MTSADEAERYERLFEAFGHGRSLPESEREPWLVALAARDADLAREVRRLLSRREAADKDPLADDAIEARKPLVPWVAAENGALADEASPEHIGPFRVLGRLGAGGMGVVYEAEQETPRRRVAVKLVRPGLAFGERLKRFRLEAEALGRLKHPGIAAIHEVGTCDLGSGEQPYFVMELVEGQPLLVHAAEARLGRAARLALVAELCDAVQHAHERGIVHRDLKPDNVLVDADGRAKVLDFGVARVRADDVPLTTIHTAQGEIVGTLTHMAPEQLAGDPSAVGPAVDVYALGVIAFELLTGRLPHEVAGLSLTQAARHITETDAPRLGTLDRSLRGDLETLVAKALDADPERRYVTPAALASDFRRYLASEPIAARPAGPIYRARKFTRRHPGLVGGAGATLLVLLVGLAASGFFAARAERNRSAAEWQTYRSALATASIALRSNEPDVAARALDSAPEALRAWEWRYLRNQHGPTSTLLAESHGPLDALCVANAEDLVATATSDGERSVLRLTPVPEGGVAQEWTLELTKVFGLAFREGDQELVVCGVAASGDLHALFVDRRTGTVRYEQELVPGPVEPLLFAMSADGERVAQLQGAHAVIVSTLDGERLLSIPDAVGNATSFGNRGKLLSRFDPQDGRGLEIYDLESGTLREQFPERHGFLAPQQARAIVQRPDHVTEVVDLDPDPRVRATVRWRIEESRSGAVFSRDGNRVLSLSFDNRLFLWDLKAGELVGPYGNTRNASKLMAFLPAGDRFVRSGEEGELHLWSVQPLSSEVFLGHASFVYSLALSPDGKLLASGAWDGYVGAAGSLRIWDLETGKERRHWGEPGEYLKTVAFAKNGRYLLLGWCDRRLALTLASARPLESVERLERLSLDEDSVKWSLRLQPLQVVTGTTGDRVYVTDSLSRLQLLDGATGQTLAQTEIDSIEPKELALSLSPDGARIVCAGQDHFLQLLDASNLSSLHTWLAHSGLIHCIQHSADGRRIYSASEDGTVRVWDADTGVPLGDPWPHDSGVLCVRPSPSGERIATGARDGLVRLWSPAGEELLRLEGHTGYVKDLVWSPDGETLYSASGDTTIRVWSAAARSD